MKRLLFIACVLLAIALISCSANNAMDEKTANPSAETEGYAAVYDTPPEPLKPIIPRYPAEARSRGDQGTVLLEVEVSKTGEVGNIAVKRSVNGLDQAAVDAVKKVTFKPGTVDGKAVGTIVIIPVQFKLN